MAIALPAPPAPMRSARAPSGWAPWSIWALTKAWPSSRSPWQAFGQYDSGPVIAVTTAESAPRTPPAHRLSQRGRSSRRTGVRYRTGGWACRRTSSWLSSATGARSSSASARD